MHGNNRKTPLAQTMLSTVCILSKLLETIENINEKDKLRKCHEPKKMKTFYFSLSFSFITTEN